MFSGSRGGDDDGFVWQEGSWKVCEDPLGICGMFHRRHRCMGGFMGGCMGGCIGGCMGGCMSGCMDSCVGGCMDGCMDSCLDGWGINV